MAVIPASDSLIKHITRAAASAAALCFAYKRRKNSDDVLDAVTYPLNGGGAVHRIKMDAVAARGQKVDYLAYGVGETCVEECIRVIAVAVYDALEI